MKPRILICIPARGGSKRLPNKNALFLDGMSLVERCARKAVVLRDSARHIAAITICVSTDSDLIAKAVDGIPFVEIVRRPKKLATDGADGTCAPIHALEKYATAGERFDGLMLMQCTSPFASSLSMYCALARFAKEPGTYVSCFEPGTPNGGYWLTPATRLMQARNWGYASASWGRMTREESIDIDCEYDLEQARRYL